MSDLQEKVEIAKKFLEKVISVFGISHTLDAKIDGERILIKVSGKDLGRLIGKNGQVISALQTLTETIANRKKRPITPVVLDIDNYLQRREQKLINDAKELANRVKKMKSPVMMDPMPSHDRRIIHLALQDDKEIKVESTGEGDERRIVIYPAETK